MFTHHVITVVLLSASYVLNWTRIGNAILVTMDVSDIFLFVRPLPLFSIRSDAYLLFPQLAKLLKYTGNQQAADVTFATFLISWIATRHVIFGRILWKVWSEPPRYIEYAWRSQDGYFWSRNTQLAFVLLLGALQVLMCLWLFMSPSSFPFLSPPSISTDRLLLPQSFEYCTGWYEGDQQRIRGVTTRTTGRMKTRKKRSGKRRRMGRSAKRTGRRH